MSETRRTRDQEIECLVAEALERVRHMSEKMTGGWKSRATAAEATIREALRLLRD